MANEYLVRIGLVKEKPTLVNHKHSYRKDGVCACGAVRKPKG